MKLKRIFSGLLAGAMLAGLVTIAPAAAADLSAFHDIRDPAVAEAAEVLRVMGIVDGNGSGAFMPESTLDRAAFCKMTVELMGNGDKVPAQQNRTIFRDVPPTHWANGYINVATQGTTTGETTAPGIIRGDAYGNFNPNRAITYAEAVTILMRVLGYGDADVGYGSKWYDGYMSTAKGVDLLAGVTAGAEAAINRGQAAILFRNLLFTDVKGGSEPYLTSLGGSVKDDSIILSTSATAADGTTGSIQTNQGTYRTDRVSFSPEFNGVRGEVALDKDEKIVAFLPRETDTIKRITLTDKNANYVTGIDGVRVDLARDVAVWQNGESTTYDKVWSTLKTGTSLVLCYNAGGKNDYLYVADAAASQDASVLVLKTKPSGGNPFASLSGNAALYKNGMAITPEDLRQYDVGVLDKGSNTIQISDRRLTGVYENAAPNTTAPATITVMGREFPVLPSAIADLQSFKIGDRMTLLLTFDNQVAGVVTPTAATGTAVGIASVTDGSCTVKLLDSDLELSGKTSSSDTLDGKLVTVSSNKKGQLSLTAVKGSDATAAIDLAKGTMGTRKLADNVKFYDCVAGGALKEVAKDDIALSRIPTGKIAFTALDYAGRVSLVILNDVTGDCYEYGYFVYESEPHEVPGLGEGAPPEKYELHYISIRNGGTKGEETKTERIQTLSAFRSGKPGGIAAANGKLAGSVELKELNGVPRSSFDVEEMTLTTTDNIFPISDKVQCHNKTTGQWYVPGEEGLTTAVGFADTLTVYYDKDPGEGGKIRLIVVE